MVAKVRFAALLSVGHVRQAQILFPLGRYLRDESFCNPDAWRGNGANQYR